MGIEPTAQAWEAWVLPLYDARVATDSSRLALEHANRGIQIGKAPEGAFPNLTIY
jgi:hypothetical protein